MSLRSSRQITVGALGTWRFPEGTYLYVGSAWGPGGLRARLSRHLRGSPKVRWHVDYLRAHADPIAVWMASDARVECAWA
ncbi:MAG: GIY-YIG nuclease family protein, partial [Anaerolineae bacterium]